MSIRPSRTHRPFTAAGIACAVLLAIVGTVGPAHARQAGGGLPQSVVASSSPLTPQQREQVRSFAETWTRALATGEGAQVSRGRNELAQPPARPGATPAFHRDYAGVLRPMLQPIIDGDDEFRAINAMIVLRSLRTPEAVEDLVALSSPRTERRPVIRIRAAGLLTDAVADAPLNPAQMDGITRAILEAASTDPEWVAAYHGFRTLARVAGRSGLPAGSITLALRSQVDLLDRLVDRAERDTAPSDSMHAIARSLLIARDQLPSLSPENAAVLRRGAAPALARLGTIAANHWDLARETSAGTKVYRDALTAANLLLSLEAAARRQPLAIDFGAKWDAGDRDGLRSDSATAKAMVDRS